MVLAVLELIVHVDQGSFKFRDLSASASQVLKLKVQATTTGTTIKTQHCVFIHMPQQVFGGQWPLCHVCSRDRTQVVSLVAALLPARPPYLLCLI